MTQSSRFLLPDPPEPLAYFESLVSHDEDFALLEAAVTLGQQADASLDVQAVLCEVDRLADALRRRLPADASPTARLRALCRYFFHDLGFAANLNDFHDPANSYLHKVLETRRGIPISLALLLIELAGQIGLKAQGVSFPGHFLVKLHLPAGEVVLDPLTGQSLSRAALEERLQLFQGPSDDTPLGLYLQAASPREFLARMLRNLKLIHRQNGQPQALLAVQQRLVRLLPTDWEERRDRGLVLLELGEPDAAADDLTVYLQGRPRATDAASLLQRLAMLRPASGPSLH